MSQRKTDRAARVFTVAADLGEGDEVALHDVLTWPRLSDAEAFCTGSDAAVSKRVVVAERGASFEGGMTMAVGEAGEWPVKLEHDRMVSPLKAGEVMSVLASDWARIGRGGLWRISATVIGHIRKTPEGAWFVAHV